MSAGTIYTELDLDFSKFEKNQHKLLQSATATSVSIEKNFQNLGVKSDKIYDAMRKSAENSLNMIKAKSTSTGNEIARAQEAFNAKMKTLHEQQFGKQVSLIDNLKSHWIAASAVIASAGIVAAKGWGMVKAGADFKEQQGILDNLARKHETTADTIVKEMRRASDGLVADADLMQIALGGIAKGLNPEQLTNLADAARILGDAVGKDATTALKDLTEALETGRTKGLKNYLGTAIDLESVFGDLTSKLTETEKSQALYNIAMIESTKLQGQQTKKVDDTADAIERLEAKWKNLRSAVEQSLAGMVGMFLNTSEGEEQARLARARIAYMKSNQSIDYASLSKMTSQDQNKYIDTLIAAENSMSEGARFAGKSVNSYQAALSNIKSNAQGRVDSTDTAKSKREREEDARIKKALDDIKKWEEIEQKKAEAIGSVALLENQDYISQFAPALAGDAWLTKYLADVDKATKAEQEKSEMLGQLALVDQKAVEDSAKNQADAYRTVYGDIGKTTEASHAFKTKALNEEYAKLKLVVGDSDALRAAQAARQKELDQELALSSNKFFKGVEVGYERMLKDQMTWAKGGLAIFNTFAKSGQSTISNVLFDGIKGDLKSFEDYWDNFFDSLLRTFTDTVAEMATQKLADAAVKPLVNFVGGAAGAAGSAAWDWLSEIDWFHAGSQMVGNQLADQRGNLSSDELLAVLKRGEIVIPPGISDDVRGGNYSSLAAWMGSSFSAPDWLSMLYSGISANVGKTPLQKDEQGNIVQYDPYALVKRALDSYPNSITKEGIAQRIANSGFAYIGGGAAPYQLVGTGREGRDYAFRANLETIDAFSKISAGVSTINIPALVLKQLNMMMGGGSGGNADPFGGIPAGASGVPGGAGIGSRMFSAYVGTAIQGLLSGQISAYGLMTPAFRAVMEAGQESYGTETGSGRYSTAGTIIGGLVAALTQNPVFGMLTATGISGYGNYSYTKEKADILAMNPDIANALAGGYGGGYGGIGGTGVGEGGDEGSSPGTSPSPGARYGALLRGPESGYTARLHGTELVVSQKKDVPVKIADSGGAGDLPPVQVNLVVDGKKLARALYKQSRSGVKAVHDRGITNV